MLPKAHARMKSRAQLGEVVEHKIESIGVLPLKLVKPSQITNNSKLLLREHLQVFPFLHHLGITRAVHPLHIAPTNLLAQSVAERFPFSLLICSPHAKMSGQQPATAYVRARVATLCRVASSFV